MRQIMAVAVLGASLAFSAVSAFADERSTGSSPVDQNQTIVTSTESGVSMGAIDAPQMGFNPVLDSHDRER